MKKKKKGVVVVEYLILSPLIFFIVTFSVLFLIFTIDYHMISNTCSDLAQELNLGDNGFKAYAGSRYNIKTNEYDNILTTPFGLVNKTGETSAFVYVTPTSEGYVESCFNYHLNRFLEEGRLNLPFCTINAVSCKVYNGSSEAYNFSTLPNVTESGDLVEICIQTTFCGLLKTKIYGYSFIV